MSHKRVSRNDDDIDVFAATIYDEARGEGTKGMEAVAHVMKNRADKDRSYWGGREVKDVCLQPQQFECWNNKSSIDIHEEDSYKEAKRVAKRVLSGKSSDPTDGCDHYNNPDKETASWVNNVRTVKRIGNHVFYSSE